MAPVEPAANRGDSLVERPVIADTVNDRPVAASTVQCGAVYSARPCSRGGQVQIVESRQQPRVGRVLDAMPKRRPGSVVAVVLLLMLSLLTLSACGDDDKPGTTIEWHVGTPVADR